ncbi:MAG: prolipoprotein diacylglyceryl transferase [Anaerolineales bacterium]|nr:prolipoprotein diacylglyceryl transferase [Anaerolineales bacterium]MCS7248575.1 prolipoprotein diacylglyceryl transferase [Anaerolineales bacterium]MDW8162388.1 prolipoprotein diacylglyceryl transferase [Anaerolineales bacterium]MDW8447727.1 prolipoprotein diacylglyceryl transferase [Anaerolineales bacterium]
MLPILQIGPLALRTPLLLVLLGLYLGITLAEARLPKGSLSAAQLNTVVFLGLGSGLVAARLVFALRQWTIFAEAPLSLLSLDGGMLDPWAGLVVGALAVLISVQRQRLSLWETLDALTPLFAVLGIFSSLAFFASGELYGIPTQMPWGVELWGAKRHPLALYHACAALLILIVLWRRLGKSRFPGEIFLQYLLSTSAAWLFLEAWRANSPLLPGGIRTVQGVAWFSMALCFWLLNRHARDLVSGSQAQNSGHIEHQSS